MNNPWQDGFDDNGDPVQSGLNLEASSGVSYQSGLVLGVVLSVNYADSSDNLLRQILQGDQQNGTTKASHIEASVLSLFSGYDENMVHSNCIVLPPGKTSRTGPTQDEPADFSEDVPNGSRPDQIQALYNGEHIPITELTGDWVVLQFIGGQMQMPVITHWFPNPYNTADPAEISDGKRWRIRRNNTDLLIDKNGDFSLSHRGGNYLQMNGKTLSIKHIEGTTVFVDDDGNFTLLTPNEVAITTNGDTVSINNGSVLVAISGNDVKVHAPDGDVNLITQRMNVLAQEMNVGPTGGTGLCNQQLAEDFTTLALAVLSMIPVVALTGGGTAGVAADQLALNLGYIARLSAPTKEFLTKVLAAE